MAFPSTGDLKLTQVLGAYNVSYTKFSQLEGNTYWTLSGTTSTPTPIIKPISLSEFRGKYPFDPASVSQFFSGGATITPPANATGFTYVLVGGGGGAGSGGGGSQGGSFPGATPTNGGGGGGGGSGGIIRSTPIIKIHTNPVFTITGGAAGTAQLTGGNAGGSGQGGNGLAGNPGGDAVFTFTDSAGSISVTSTGGSGGGGGTPGGVGGGGRGGGGGAGGTPGGNNGNTGQSDSPSDSNGAGGLGILTTTGEPAQQPSDPNQAGEGGQGGPKTNGNLSGNLGSDGSAGGVYITWVFVPIPL